MTKPTNIYVTNRELLAEVHKSKLTYCSYLNEEDAYQDYIVNSLDEITDEVIEEARAKRRKALRSKKPVEIPTEDLVFRVMTYDHIPLDPSRTKKPRSEKDKYAKTPFPPFKHYRLIDGEPVEVLRSHWKDGIHNGHFCVDHGKINHRLAKMFLLLTERIASRYNWRGYSYNDEMRSLALLQLSMAGLQFDESKTDSAFSFYTTTVNHCFLRILTNEKKEQHIRDSLLVAHGEKPSHSFMMDHEMTRNPALDGTTRIKGQKKRGAPKKNAPKPEPIEDI